MIETDKKQESNRNSTNKLIITEWITLAAVFVGCFFFLHKEIQGIDSRLESRIQAQEQRTDKLYEMFCSMQGQLKDEMIEMKKEFYQIMKENRS